MIKKIVSVLLVFAMTLGMSTSALAAVEQKRSEAAYQEYQSNATTTEEVVYVDDGAGNIIPVTVIETTYPALSNGDVSVLGLSPEYPVGSTKTYTVKVSNAMLQAPASGVVLTQAMKSTAAEIAANAIAAKLGSKFIPGLNLAVAILGFIGAVNAACGNSGIKVTVNLKYKETYLHKEGYYLYGWDAVSAYLGTY